MKKFLWFDLSLGLNYGDNEIYRGGISGLI